MCRLEDGLVYNNGLRIVTLHGTPLLRRVTEIIDRVVEARLYIFWIPLDQHLDKVVSQLMDIVNQIDEYYKLQPVTHATSILSPFNGLVSKYPLCHFRVDVQSPVKQKLVKLIICGPNCNLEL